MERTVYIPHLPTRQNPIDNSWVPTISLEPAAKIGKLRTLCEHPSDASPENFSDACNYISKEMQGVNSDDFILMAGDPVICSFAIHCALLVCRKANILRWNREERSYDHLTIGHE